MTAYWKRFWGSVLSLGAIVGFYLAALQVDLLWAFWAVVAASALIALVTVGGPTVLRWFEKARKYDSALQAAGRYQEEARELRQRLDRLEDALSQQWLSGVEEGRRQIWGGLMAAVWRSPKLVGVEVSSNGTPRLLAKSDREMAKVGARFRVESIATGAVKGVVEVHNIDTDKGLVALGCIDPSSQEFWDHIAERAHFDAGPPKGVRLVAAMIGPEGQDSPHGGEPESARGQSEKRTGLG